jgi:acetoin utilization protein AcuB
MGQRRSARERRSQEEEAHAQRVHAVPQFVRVLSDSSARTPWDRRGTGLAAARLMSKPIPRIEKFMTPAPHSIGRAQPLTVAHQMMHTHRIRHLPVLDGGALVGMLSDRDVALILSMKDVDASKTTVDDAMTSVVYSVSPDAPLDEVARTMAEHRYGSAVILSNEKCVGVFTTVDACRALAELLHGRLAS